LGLGIKPKSGLAAFDYDLETEDEQAVIDLSPNFSLWKTLDPRGMVVTAQSNHVVFP
jgi:hypothetical protein